MLGEHRLDAFARCLSRAENCVKDGDFEGLVKSMSVLDRRLAQLRSLPQSTRKSLLLGKYTGLVASTGVSLSKSGPNEDGPSLKPPKEWMEKMRAKVGSGGKKKYSDKAKNAIIGDIWHNKMRAGHKASVRKRYGKKYGPAKKSFSGQLLYIPAGK